MHENRVANLRTYKPFHLSSGRLDCYRLPQLRTTGNLVAKPLNLQSSSLFAGRLDHHLLPRVPHPAVLRLVRRDALRIQRQRAGVIPPHRLKEADQEDLPHLCAGDAVKPSCGYLC